MTLENSLDRVFALMEEARGLGHRRLEDGTELFGHVPHDAPEAWLHLRFRPLVQAELEQIEDEVGRRIPSDYAYLLRRANGLSLFSGALSLDGLRTDYSRQVDEWQPFSLRLPNVLERPPAAPEAAFFIGGYTWDGSRLFIDDVIGTVGRCARDSAELFNRWPTLAEMLDSESLRLRGLFDEQGRELDSDSPTTPAPNVH